MHCDEQIKRATSHEPLMALDWSALGTMVRARSTMLVSETFLAASHEGIMANVSPDVEVLAVDRGCVSL